MADAPDSMLVHCGWCRHEWFAFKLPMPISEAAELAAKMRCPECDRPSSKIYCVPAPVYGDDINISAERVKKTGES
jgi:hypothetical protein